MRLEQIQPVDMPRAVSIRTIQHALAIMGLPTGTTGRWDARTVAGLSAFVMAADTGAARPPRVAPGDPGQMVFTPGQFVDDLQQAANLALELMDHALGDRRGPGPAGRNSNGNVLLWLVPLRNMVPLLNNAMTVSAQNHVLTMAQARRYEKVMDAVDAASESYGEMFRAGPLQEKAVELIAMTDQSGLMTLTFDRFVDSWMQPLPRWEGEVLDPGSLANALVVGGIIVGVIAIAAVAGVGLWQEPARQRALAARDQQRANLELVQRLPEQITPEEYNQMVKELNRNNPLRPGNDDDEGFPWMLTLGAGAGIFGTAMVLSPRFRQTVFGFFRRS